MDGFEILSRRFAYDFAKTHRKILAFTPRSGILRVRPLVHPTADLLNLIQHHTNLRLVTLMMSSSKSFSPDRRSLPARVRVVALSLAFVLLITQSAQAIIIESYSFVTKAELACC